MGTELREKIVISASRRTDIPAFYMNWFMEGIRRGFFDVENPFSGQVGTVPAVPEEVHTIVFFSKDYGLFLQKKYWLELLQKGFHLFFHFTINSENTVLEPRIPGLRSRLEQARVLVEEFGPSIITWRFDPVCFYSDGKGVSRCNLNDFDRIAEVIGSLGIRRCITSFMDDYRKIQKRTRDIPGFKFVFPEPEKKAAILLDMARILAAYSIELLTCCEKEILELLPPEPNIRAASCIPNHLLQELFGGRISQLNDYGQRRKKGCGCKISRDIGSYRLQPCRHNCLYCYANPLA